MHVNLGREAAGPLRGVRVVDASAAVSEAGELRLVSNPVRFGATPAELREMGAIQ